MTPGVTALRWTPLVLLLVAGWAAYELVPWVRLTHGTAMQQEVFQTEMARALRAIRAGEPARLIGGVFTTPRVSLAGSPAEMLGCATADGPLGPFVRVGPMGQTSVAGVFAAGDCASPAHSVTPALGAGALAGVGCHQSLLFPDNFPPLEVSIP